MPQPKQPAMGLPHQQQQGLVGGQIVSMTSIAGQGQSQGQGQGVTTSFMGAPGVAASIVKGSPTGKGTALKKVNNRKKVR